MLNPIVFEIVDVSVTFAAASMLLRMILARPAVRRRRQPRGAEPVYLEVIEPAIEPAVEVFNDDGITWPKPAWPGLPAQMAGAGRA
jgi:hypothetical protein